MDPAHSFQIELPPYWQDLCDAGKAVSDGWIFCNSFNTEMATGGIEMGNAFSELNDPIDQRARSRRSAARCSDRRSVAS